MQSHVQMSKYVHRRQVESCTNKAEVLFQVTCNNIKIKRTWESKFGRFLPSKHLKYVRYTTNVTPLLYILYTLDINSIRKKETR